MRLRLVIHRNELPAVSTLWPIPSIDLKKSIAQLLASVNGTFPLECDFWGLEDYSVSVGGYECLHYHEIGAVLQEDDEVVVKPLQYAEVKARTLTGRDQISKGGKHLLDGVPFGKPQLKKPVRPELWIPPRRATTAPEDARIADSESETRSQLEDLRFEDVDDDEDDDDDGDYDGEEELPEESSEEDNSEGTSEGSDGSDGSEASGGSANASTASAASSHHNRRTDTSKPDDSSSASSSGSGSDIETDAEAVLATKSPWNGCESKAPPTSSSKSNPLKSLVRGLPAIHAPALMNGVKRKRENEDDSPGCKSLKLDHTQEPNPVGLPFQGKQETKRRNARRRDTKKLKYLKQLGELPQDATIAALREYKKRAVHGVQTGLDEEDNDVVDDAMEISPSHETSAPSAAGAVEGMSIEIVHSRPTDTNTLPKDHHIEGLVNVVDVHEQRQHSTPSAAGAEKDACTDSAYPPLQSRGSAMDELSTKMAEHAMKLLKKRQKLLLAIASGGVDVAGLEMEVDAAGEGVQSEAAPNEISSKVVPVNGHANDLDPGDSNRMTIEPAVEELSTAASVMVPPSVTRRSRLDLDGSRRLVFGSLGVRVPKSQDEKDALQKRLAARPSKNAVTSQFATNLSKPIVNDAVPLNIIQQGEDDEQDAGPNAWRRKIQLSAVECSDEGVTLSKPPFPFFQRWDPQYQRSHNRKRNAGRKYLEAKPRNKRKRDEGPNGTHFETYDKYNENGMDDSLNYDDGAEDEDEDYWEEGALINGGFDGEDGEDDEEAASAAKQLQDEADNHWTVDDGFPPLPEDATTLPILEEADARENDFVVYKELVCSVATTWQPKMLLRTAQLQGKDEGGWTVKLALRDEPPRQYDEEGDRVYQKFEMEGLSEDEDGENARTRTVQWAQLLEPQLLMRSEAVAEKVETS